jgi:hypothetical protein
VAAIAAVFEPGALATAIVGSADADVIEMAEPEAVDLEAPAADVAADLTKSVKAKTSGGPDLKDADAQLIGRADQADGAIGFFGRRRRSARGHRLFSAALSCGI